MIWQFGEIGYDVSIDYNGRLGRKPIKWNYLNELNRKIFTYMVLSNWVEKKHSIFPTHSQK